ncbi:MAG: MFS transporter [Cytophagales bacterium]|nr:MAG: MFS transporter [Cytophagales bacterium]
MQISPNSSFQWKDILNTTVIVAALGYFVDVYDLVLFLIVGKESLADIGIAPSLIISEFQFLLNVQMIGMLIGGIFWGILGDKKGRLSVLFGSILMYSLANIANGFVNSIEMYALLRLIAGIGLAGELGAGITLVSELMHKEKRGYGTMVVASIGVTGAVVAALVAKSGWQMAYFIGGGLGLSLLLLRVGIFESKMFNKVEAGVSKGNFFYLFATKERATRYIQAIMLGLPVWFVIGILVGLAPVFAKKLNVNGSIADATCVMLCYTGLVFGDIVSGALSQVFKSRKKSFFLFYILCMIAISAYLNANNVNTTMFYSLITLLGFSVGFWAMFVTNAAEQFGTNIRATTTTTIPNFVRGALVPLVYLFKSFTQQLGLITGTYLLGVLVFLITLIALYFTKETFGKELDYIE